MKDMRHFKQKKSNGGGLIIYVKEKNLVNW